MLRGRSRSASLLTSGTTSGTSGSIRKAAELSTTVTPRAVAIGAHSSDTSSGTSNMATSTPSNASGVSSRTVSWSPRQLSCLPAERPEARSRISPQTVRREGGNSSMTVPTEPVAPTTASVGCAIAGLPAGARVYHRFLVATELELIVHSTDGGVEVGVAADHGDADLRGRDHLDVD